MSKSKKINSIDYGWKVLLAGVTVAAIIPAIIWLVTGIYYLWISIAGVIILVGFFGWLAVETRQDNSDIPYYERNLKETIPFDPASQSAVIRCSVCTGEKVAGFKSRTDGHFTEVMLIRNEADEQRFKKIYDITEVRKEY